MKNSDCNKKDQLEKDGFTIVKSVLSGEDVEGLKDSCRLLLERSPLPRCEFSVHRSSDVWKYETYTDGKTNLAIDILGEDPELDRLMDKIFSNSKVQDLLEFLHGTSYKITQVNIRKVVRGDSGLNYHQDTEGETGIGIFLDDRPDNEGTTVFIPNSHWWPFTIRELLFYPRIFIPLIPKKWVKGTTGKAGDMYFFINRVWHGRPALKKAESSTAILISVFGEGGSYRIHKVSEEMLNKMPETIGKLVDHRNGLKEVGDGIVTVEKTDNSSGIMGAGIFPSNQYGFLMLFLRPWFKTTTWLSSIIKR